MAKIKVHYTEGFSTWILKEPVIIDTKDYPELEGLSIEEMETYLNDNAYEMKSSDKDGLYCLYDEAACKDDLRVKETNNEVNFLVEFEEENK